MRGFAKRSPRRPVRGASVRCRSAPLRVSSPGNRGGRITSLISFFNSRTLKNKRVAFGAGWSRARARARAHAVDQSAGIVTRNTNSWSGNECFNNANSPSVSPASLRPCRSPPSVPGHGSQNLFSSADRCNFALSWQRRVHRSSDVSRPPPLHTLSLQSAVNCFQLNCLPFSRHPFAVQHRLFAPLNAARFRDAPNFRREMSRRRVGPRRDV